MLNINEYFGSLSLMASLVAIITGYLNTYVPFLKSANGTWKQVTSWVISIALVFIGQFKGVGLVAETTALWTAITGVAVGLIANGIFDIKIVQAILSFIKANNSTKA